MFFKKEKLILSPTGFYIVNGKTLIPLNELPKTGSYNDIAESLGFETYHSVFTWDSKKINHIAFKRRTKEPIFVEVRDKTLPLTDQDVVITIQNEIDWKFEWGQLDFEDKLLNDDINNDPNMKSYEEQIKFLEDAFSKHNEMIGTICKEITRIFDWQDTIAKTVNELNDKFSKSTEMQLEIGDNTRQALSQINEILKEYKDGINKVHKRVQTLEFLTEQLKQK